MLFLQILSREPAIEPLASKTNKIAFDPEILLLHEESYLCDICKSTTFCIRSSEGPVLERLSTISSCSPKVSTEIGGAEATGSPGANLFPSPSPSMQVPL